MPIQDQIAIATRDDLRNVAIVAHVAVNLKAPFFFMQAVVADLVARQAPGTIVNIISTSEHGGQRLARLAPSAGHGDQRPLAGRRPRDARAEAGGAAADEHDAVLKERHPISLGT